MGHQTPRLTLSSEVPLLCSAGLLINLQVPAAVASRHSLYASVGLHVFADSLHAFATDHPGLCVAGPGALLNFVPAQDDLMDARLNFVPAWDDLMVARLNFVFLFLDIEVFVLVLCFSLPAGCDFQVLPIEPNQEALSRSRNLEGDVSRRDLDPFDNPVLDFMPLFSPCNSEITSWKHQTIAHLPVHPPTPHTQLKRCHSEDHKVGESVLRASVPLLLPNLASVGKLASSYKPSSTINNNCGRRGYQCQHFQLDQLTDMQLLFLFLWMRV
ncbi:hypothetical protein ATANTOWER_008716 [Ataeniobius toweri]|uniref:Uncharacterized protein n=1 Tax=Ataeniobius toweri TaxID=208326 RepID=A0ABU7AE12_9TELE|nr:hypothetical protein [Ataeniobius toweri]